MNIEKYNEISENLERYKKVLSSYTNDYLKSLLNLEVTPFGYNSFSKEEGKVLEELKIYRDILIYNVHNNVVGYFEDDEIENATILKNENGVTIFKPVPNFDKQAKIVDFKYSDYPVLNLYQIVENDEQKDKEKEKTIQEIKEIKARLNPYRESDKYGSPYRNWQNMKNMEVKDKLNYLNYLNENYALTDEKVAEEILTNEYNELLLNYLEIGKYGFTEAENTSNLTKTLVKKYPGIDVNNNIRFY